MRKHIALLLVILLACLLSSALAEEAHVLDATADLAPMEQGAVWQNCDSTPPKT